MWNGPLKLSATQLAAETRATNIPSWGGVGLKLCHKETKAGASY